MVQRPQQNLPDSVMVVRDMEFGKGGNRPLKLHLLRPRRPATNLGLPAIIYLHGGGWREGSRDRVFTFRGNGMANLAAQDYVVAAVEYRLSGEAQFPAQIEDCKCAVRFLRANASRLGLDADHIGVWGTSAGGHLAALLGTTGHASDLEGSGGWTGTSSAVQAVVDWYGPIDLLQIGPEYAEAVEMAGSMIGGPLDQNKAKADRANPITYLSQDCPPFLIMHGMDDTWSPPGQGKLLEDALKTAGVESELVMVPNKGHEYLGPDAVAKVYEFLGRHLRVK